MCPEASAFWLQEEVEVEAVQEHGGERQRGLYTDFKHQYQHNTEGLSVR